MVTIRNFYGIASDGKSTNYNTNIYVWRRKRTQRMKENKIMLKIFPVACSIDIVSLTDSVNLSVFVLCLVLALQHDVATRTPSYITRHPTATVCHITIASRQHCEERLPLHVIHDAFPRFRLKIDGKPEKHSNQQQQAAATTAQLRQPNRVKKEE